MEWCPISVSLKSKLGANFVVSRVNRAQNLIRPICQYSISCRVNVNHMTVTDGMGFNKDEAKKLLISCPILYKDRAEGRLQAS